MVDKVSEITNGPGRLCDKGFIQAMEGIGEREKSICRVQTHCSAGINEELFGSTIRPISCPERNFTGGIFTFLLYGNYGLILWI